MAPFPCVGKNDSSAMHTVRTYQKTNQPIKSLSKFRTRRKGEKKPLTAPRRLPELWMISCDTEANLLPNFEPPIGLWVKRKGKKKRHVFSHGFLQSSLQTFFSKFSSKVQSSFKVPSKFFQNPFQSPSKSSFKVIISSSFNMSFKSSFKASKFIFEKSH